MAQHEAQDPAEQYKDENQVEVTPVAPGLPPEHHDDTDVDQALERETHDGKGDDEPGESDFKGYATEGVEQESEQ